MSARVATRMPQRRMPIGPCFSGGPAHVQGFLVHTPVPGQRQSAEVRGRGTRANFPRCRVRYCLARLPAHVEAATRAQAAVLSRTAGAAKRRDVKVADVRLDLEQLRVYVQGLADAAQPEDAARLIVSAGFFVKGKIARAKQTLAARAGKRRGSVHLATKFAGKTALYSWGYSVDRVRWTEVKPTMQAKTTIDSLTPGTRYFFRSRAVHRKGTDDWSTPIELLVV
jgi:hypothetical protein